LPSFHEEALVRWTADGRAGDMHYLTREPARRAHPERSLQSAKSVISLAVNYFVPAELRPENRSVGRVAKYAHGADYHKIIEKKLKLLSKFVSDAGGPGTEVKAYVDTGPILEKAFAQQAGLGFFGKNTNLITKNHGSWVFLASLITNLEFAYDEPHPGACGTCRLCIDACPTDALTASYEIDARRCIAYLSIETKEEPSEELKRGVGEWAFGCDICQDVCPYNKKAKLTRHPELSEKKAGTWLDLEAVMKMETDEEFRTAFVGSPLKRPKLAGIKRNALLVLENQARRHAV
jgi:epoxyqueuosine reductase